MYLILNRSLYFINTLSTYCQVWLNYYTLPPLAHWLIGILAHCSDYFNLLAESRAAVKPWSKLKAR
jgi:hypothetical protein